MGASANRRWFPAKRTRNRDFGSDAATLLGISWFLIWAVGGASLAASSFRLWPWLAELLLPFYFIVWVAALFAGRRAIAAVWRWCSRLVKSRLTQRPPSRIRIRFVAEPLLGCVHAGSGPYVRIVREPGIVTRAGEYGGWPFVGATSVSSVCRGMTTPECLLECRAAQESVLQSRVSCERGNRRWMERSVAAHTVAQGPVERAATHVGQPRSHRAFIRVFKLSSQVAATAEHLRPYAGARGGRRGPLLEPVVSKYVARESGATPTEYAALFSPLGVFQLGAEPSGPRQVF